MLCLVANKPEKLQKKKNIAKKYKVPAVQIWVKGLIKIFYFPLTKWQKIQNSEFLWPGSPVNRSMSNQHTEIPKLST